MLLLKSNEQKTGRQTNTNGYKFETNSDSTMVFHSLKYLGL